MLHMQSGITVFACQPVVGVTQAVQGGQLEGVWIAAIRGKGPKVLGYWCAKDKSVRECYCRGVGQREKKSGWLRDGGRGELKTNQTYILITSVKCNEDD